MLTTKACPNCGTTFRTFDGRRFCFVCYRLRRKAIRRSDYLTPLPRYRPPIRRDERGVFQ